MKKSLFVIFFLVLNLIGFCQTATIADGKQIFKKEGKQYVASMKFSEVISPANMQQVQQFMKDNGLKLEENASKKKTVTYRLIVPENMANIHVLGKFLYQAGVTGVIVTSESKSAVSVDEFMSKH